MDVLCDTSFLMVLVAKPLRQVDRVEAQFGRLEFLVPDIVIGELTKIAKKAGPKRSMLAKTALDLAAGKFKIVAIHNSGHVDDLMIEYALRKKCAVATVDTNLRKRLVSNGIIVITLSKDRMLVANPHINDYP